MDVSEALKEIRSMSLEGRIRLLQAIWDDIAAEQEPADLTDAQKRELDQRLAAYEASPVDVVPWEQVRAGKH
ncbi:MAG TPA: addiction module protein [Gemmataceae bacterium]